MPTQAPFGKRTRGRALQRPDRRGQLGGIGEGSESVDTPPGEPGVAHGPRRGRDPEQDAVPVDALCGDLLGVVDQVGRQQPGPPHDPFRVPVEHVGHHRVAAGGDGVARCVA